MATTKPKLKYRVVQGRNPKTGDPMNRPQIAERDTYTTDQVVEYALNAGYVRGQFHDMRGALNGFIEAVQQLGKDGKSVNLNDWLRVHGELTGSCDETRRLSAKNGYRVRITALKELKRDVSEFSWVNVDSAGVVVKVNTLMYNGSPVDGRIMKAKEIIVTGKNLAFSAEAGDMITLSWQEGDETKTAFVTPTESDYSHVVLPWPAELDDVADDTEVTFLFRTHGGVEGGELQLATKVATVVTGE